MTTTMWPQAFVFCSAIGVISGVAGCIMFGKWDNYNASFWAVFSAILAFCVGHLHFLFASRVMGRWHNQITLGQIIPFAFTCGVISVAAGIWYLSMHFYYHECKEEQYPYKNSFLVASVWAFMSAKWSAALFYTCYKYIAILDGIDFVLPDQRYVDLVEEAEEEPPVVDMRNLRTPILMDAGSEPTYHTVDTQHYYRPGINVKWPKPNKYNNPNRTWGKLRLASAKQAVNYNEDSSENLSSEATSTPTVQSGQDESNNTSTESSDNPTPVVKLCQGENGAYDNPVPVEDTESNDSNAVTAPIPIKRQPGNGFN